MRAEFCNRFLNIWSGFGAFSHVGNLAEIFDGMNIRVIEKSNTLRDAGWAERLGGAFSHVGDLAEMLDGMNSRVIEESNTLGRPGRREGGVRGDAGRAERLGGAFGQKEKSGAVCWPLFIHYAQ